MSRRDPVGRVWRAIVALVMDTRTDWRRRVADATGLPFTRLRALRRVAERPMTLRSLAESLGTDAPAATVAVNDLEERGLVTRTTHPDDRRAKLVAVTAAGRAVMRAYDAVSDRAPEPLASLSADDVKVLARVFERAAGERRARQPTSLPTKGGAAPTSRVGKR